MAHLLSNAIRRSNPTHVFSVVDLDPDIRLWRICVKVLRKFNHVYGNIKSMNFFLVDQKGDKIHATFEYGGKNDSLDALKEGEWAVVENFDLERVQGGFRPTPHIHKIRLIPETCVTPISYHGTRNFFSFAEFEDIHGDRCNLDHCIDLIGHVRSFGSFSTGSQTFDRKKKQRDIIMLLSNGKSANLSVTLGMSYAEPFSDSLVKCRSNTIICIIRFAKLLKRDGVWKAMTAHHYSQILIDPPYPEADQIRFIVSQPRS